MKKLLLIAMLLSIGSLQAMWYRKQTTVGTTRKPVITKTSQAQSMATEPVAQASAQEVNPEEVEVALIAAINSGDTGWLKQLIEEKKIDVSKPFKLIFYKGSSPLEIVFEKNTPKKFEVAELLLNAGADKKQLEQFLSQAIKDEDFELVEWLLAHNVADSQGKAKAALEEYNTNKGKAQTIWKTAYEKALAKLGQTEAASEQAALKKPLVLKPVAKPAPAKSAPKQPIIISEGPETGQSSTGTAAPVLARKPVVLTPVRKPAAAKSASRSVTLQQMATEKQVAEDIETQKREQERIRREQEVQEAQNIALQSAMPQEAAQEEYESVSAR